MMIQPSPSGRGLGEALSGSYFEMSCVWVNATVIHKTLLLSCAPSPLTPLPLGEGNKNPALHLINKRPLPQLQSQ